LKRIDAHTHCYANPAEVALLESLDLKLLNICVAEYSHRDWRKEQARPYQRQAADHSQTFAWCTTFDLPELPFKPRDYADRVIQGLQRDFDAGAIACKVWKNIGMELQDADGRYVMVDDSIFEPIFSFLEQSGRPLLTHLGEPLICWRPLDPDVPHSEYYRQNPKWHMYGKEGFPSHEEIMAARDRLVHRHPRLRIIGAHLGSMEFDLAAIARRLEQFPNFAIDTAARLADLAYLGPAVGQFIQKYSDRILWGTDLGTNPCHYPEGYRPDRSELIRNTYKLEWDYFTTDKTLTISGRTVQGLNLPAPVQQRFFRDNARDWYPGL
jgi:hypothetical protein